MKNQYALELQRRKQKKSADDTLQGVQFGLYVVAVALNNLYGFGADRLSRLEAEVNRIIEEEFGNDMEKASYELAQRIEQIRGKKVENKRAN